MVSNGTPEPQAAPGTRTWSGRRRVGRLAALICSLVVLGLVGRTPASGAVGPAPAKIYGVASTADAESVTERVFVEKINELRRAHGLGELEVDVELAAGAESWTEQLQVDDGLSHAADLSVGVTSYWLKLGENVGVAPVGEVEALFDAFVASPTHLANLIDPDFTHAGIAVQVDDDGRMWTTHRFMHLGSAVVD